MCGTEMDIAVELPLPLPFELAVCPSPPDPDAEEKGAGEGEGLAIPAKPLACPAGEWAGLEPSDIGSSLSLSSEMRQRLRGLPESRRSCECASIVILSLPALSMVESSEAAESVRRMGRVDVEAEPGNGPDTDRDIDSISSLRCRRL